MIYNNFEKVTLIAVAIMILSHEIFFIFHQDGSFLSVLMLVFYSVISTVILKALYEVFRVVYKRSRLPKGHKWIKFGVDSRSLSNGPHHVCLKCKQRIHFDIEKLSYFTVSDVKDVGYSSFVIDYNIPDCDEVKMDRAML